MAPHTPPLHEEARPRELEDPFRTGEGHIFRIPLTRRGIVVGFWRPATDVVLEEEEAGKLLEAVEGLHIPGITATEIADWARTRHWSWLALLVRRFPALGALLGRWTGSGEPDAPRRTTPREREDQDSGVVEWVDAPVIDMEEARVRGQDMGRTFSSVIAEHFHGCPAPVGLPFECSWCQDRAKSMASG